jgi:RimJ/RimL family protein N-acetyltransferase
MISWAFGAPEAGGWGFRRIHIRCAERNLASRRVPQKLGLTQEATLRAHRWAPEHGWVDTLAWGVLAEEWDPTADRLKRS